MTKKFKNPKWKVQKPQKRPQASLCMMISHWIVYCRYKTHINFEIICANFEITRISEARQDWHRCQIDTSHEYGLKPPIGNKHFEFHNAQCSMLIAIMVSIVWIEVKRWDHGRLKLIVISTTAAINSFLFVS